MLTVRAGEMRVILGDEATRVEHRAAELFVEEVRRRSGLDVAIDRAPRARYALVIGTVDTAEGVREYWEAHSGEDELGEDGFHLATTPDSGRRMYVVGESPSGVVAGVGKLLRVMRCGNGSVAIPALTISDAPRLPVRGIYFATHFHNFYHVAPLEEVDQVIEDFALWGGNHLHVWFDMHHFQSFQDPAAQEHLARLKHFGDTAHSLGMKFGVGFLANEAYDSSPEHLRADHRTGTAHYRRELCPSKPGALELIGKWQAEVMDAFPELDSVWTWPYDQGGCACEDCAPWGANGFLRASEQLAALYRERFPEGELWLSTWLFDSGNAKGEYDGLLEYIRAKQPDWLDGILMGTHGDWVPEPLLTRPHPERYPLTCFPEISMYGMSPWGEHGANPLPAFCTRLAEKLRGHVVGGWPYSEGIYEDLNKFYWTRFYWNPGIDTDEVLAEYASYYLGPEVASDAARLFHLMERTHWRRGWNVVNLDDADEEWRLARSIDKRLPEWARRSWRWRIIYIRAAIDGTLKAEGPMTPEAQETLRPLCDELVGIYHAKSSFIRPPPLPDPTDPGNLAFGRPVTVSSILPGYEGRERQLVDGILSQLDADNFWCHDRDAEKTAQVTVDLGERVPIKEVGLQFRGIGGVFWFVPESIAFEVSTDGEGFETVTTSRDVPVEGDPYKPDLRTYAIGREGRHVRLTLGPSQHVGDQYAGTLELTEIEVYAE